MQIISVIPKNIKSMRTKLQTLIFLSRYHILILVLTALKMSQHSKTITKTLSKAQKINSHTFLSLWKFYISKPLITWTYDKVWDKLLNNLRIWVGSAYFHELFYQLNSLLCCESIMTESCF